MRPTIAGEEGGSGSDSDAASGGSDAEAGSSEGEGEGEDDDEGVHLGARLEDLSEDDLDENAWEDAETQQELEEQLE